MGNYKKGGYKKRYIISKTNGKPVDPMADYFVLRLDADPHARKALYAYSDSVKYDNPKFASEIITHLRQVEKNIIT